MMDMKDLITRNMLCIQCKKIYTTSIFDKIFVYFIISGILYMIAKYFIKKDNFITPTPYIILGAFFVYLIVTILLLYFAYFARQAKNCKVCNGKKTLIDLDNAEAQQIIKENNLSVPE